MKISRSLLFHGRYLLLCSQGGFEVVQCALGERCGDARCKLEGLWDALNKEGRLLRGARGCENSDQPELYQQEERCSSRQM